MKSLIIVIFCSVLIPYSLSGQSKFHSKPVDSIPLRKNITWLSIPQHQRTMSPSQTETHTVFDPDYLSGLYPVDIGILHNCVDTTPPHNESYAFSLFNFTGWEHDRQMADVNSTRGYKMQIIPTQEGRYLYLYGQKESPYTTINLYEDKSTWIGYFIEEEQDIFNAFGTTIDDIYEIKHQDWACIFTDVPWFSPVGSGDEPRWYCDQQQTNIKYGEMVVVKPSTDVIGFQWNKRDHVIVGEALPTAQNFTYKEEPDYQIYLIALDSTENPLEIGAFAGNICIGACIVEPTDSIVMIKGYNKGSSGDSISFEAFYGTKSNANTRISEYYVYNEKEKHNEKRAIRSSEMKGVYFISFSDLKVKLLSDEIEPNSLAVYPNPARGEFTVEFEVPNKNQITIRLLDMYGYVLQTVYKGTLAKGKHITKVKLIDQNGINIPDGLYFLEMETSTGQYTSQKIMVRQPLNNK